MSFSNEGLEEFSIFLKFLIKVLELDSRAPVLSGTELWLLSWQLADDQKGGEIPERMSVEKRDS